MVSNYDAIPLFLTVVWCSQSLFGLNMARSATSLQFLTGIFSSLGSKAIFPEWTTGKFLFLPDNKRKRPTVSTQNHRTQIQMDHEVIVPIRSYILCQIPRLENLFCPFGRLQGDVRIGVGEPTYVSDFHINIV